MTARPMVVILNGVSSVGKSSIARALQAIATRPMLHVALDDFLAMLPPRSFGTPDGLTFVTRDDDGFPSSEVIVGPVVTSALAGMRRAIAALALAGNHLIVDEVMFGDGEEADYRGLLADCDVRLVAVTAPLDVIEARERARGDRTLGLARWQAGRVHRGCRYDLTIDTSKATPAESARAIRDAFDL